MSIVEQVEKITDNEEILTSQFYTDYQDILSSYNTLIENGIITKRQSQLCSVSDKLQLIMLNCNYYKSEKNN
jgi:hypothetical protein